jgi:hypothetical protein
MISVTIIAAIAYEIMRRRKETQLAGIERAKDEED